MKTKYVYILVHKYVLFSIDKINPTTKVEREKKGSLVFQPNRLRPADIVFVVITRV